jgi:hypothetical protein
MSTYLHIPPSSSANTPFSPYIAAKSHSSRRGHIEAEYTIPLAPRHRVLLLLAFPRVATHSGPPSLRAVCAGDSQIELFDIIDSIREVELVSLVRAVVGLVSRHSN